MKIKIISLGDKKLSEIISKEIVIKNVQDALDLMANLPSNYLILYEHNLNSGFFDLSTQVAGEVLQKFTNYRVRLAIIGDFSKYKSKSLKDFIYESNKHKEYLFVDSMDKVKEIWQSL